jgi:hypothetical protein
MIDRTRISVITAADGQQVVAKGTQLMRLSFDIDGDLPVSEDPIAIEPEKVDQLMELTKTHEIQFDTMSGKAQAVQKDEKMTQNQSEGEQS